MKDFDGDTAARRKCHVLLWGSTWHFPVIDSGLFLRLDRRYMLPARQTINSSAANFYIFSKRTIVVHLR